MTQEVKNISREDLFDPFAGWESNRKLRALMELNGLSVEFHSPKAWTKEGMQGLPPSNRRPAINALDIPNPLEEWLSEPATADGVPIGSWVVPVMPEEYALWFNFTQNNHHTDDVAFVPRVQRLNAITALEMDHAVMEQYKAGMPCPYHGGGTLLQADLYCPRCGFKWSAQNYYASTTGKTMWADGWRTRGSNGEPLATVRQFILTQDEKRGVAAQTIGARRTHTIEFAAFLSKEPKPQPVYGHRRDSMYGAVPESFGTKGGGVRARAFEALDDEATLESLHAPIEIGAGVEIKQDFGVDPKPLDYWNKKPSAIFVIHYVHVAIAVQAIADGWVDRTLGGEGPLAGLITGSPTKPYSSGKH